MGRPPRQSLAHPTPSSLGDVMAAENRTVYSPAGEKYEAGSLAEVTRLVAQGYTEKKPDSKSKS